MTITPPITIDFETEAIEGNPITNPPKPVGVAMYIPGRDPFYLSWGHPGENNTTFAAAHEYLKKIRNSKQPILFHNASFDLSVWNHWFCNAKWHWLDQSWRRVHDTMYLLFLDDPYSTNLSLKPNAEKYLNLPPAEQDELHAWILKNVPEATRKTAGAYIARAPADLVGKYAIGDVVRTRQLFDLLYAKIVEKDMVKAYEREQRLFPILFNGTIDGIRLDRSTLEYHTEVYEKCLSVGRDRLAKFLGSGDSIHYSDDALADALEKAGAVKEWTITKTGKRSMSKDNLKILIPEVKILMDYNSVLETSLQTFMRPWLEFSAKDGRLHPNWNQVRQARDDRGHSKGTRTGRLSSDSPNFQNVPSEYTLPTGEPLPVPEGLHPPPCMRRYCLPEVGHVWLKRDFSSQEIRILAHFEDGTLAEAYRADPNLDPHELARQLIYGIINILFARKSVKITGFSLIYGTGVAALSGQLNTSYEEAYQIKNSYLAAFPAVRELMDDVQRRGKSGQPIRTWGGRIYFAEAPKEVNGRWMDFAYKLLNYLIQGSAADQTKESICDWADNRKWHDIFLATVHDEINISAPEECWRDSMQRLANAMNADRFDVPMLSEGYMGHNWHELEKVE
jgi:DNA polymerase-1